MIAIARASIKRRHNRHSQRRGFSLLQSMVACALFGTFFASLTPVIARLSAVQDQMAQRDLAIVELRNLAEQGLYQTSADPLTPSPKTLALLPECEFAQHITDDPDFAETRRVELKLSWLPAPNQPREQVILCYWIPQPAEVAR
ncbi:MAG: type II secretion system protein [Planctomycetaceae bacterium]|nr:type II secretion system protein [Planctomycetaceae bacterium]